MTSAPRRRMHGLTLVELLVALALTSTIVAASSAALLLARRGFSTVDAVSQLQDNARFAVDVILRTAVQSGYLDVGYAVETQGTTFKLATTGTPVAYVQGYDNALQPIGAVGINGSRSTGCASSAGSACANGSDVLVVRAQASERVPGATTTDKALINCMGNAADVVPTSRNDLLVSVFYVDVGSDNEPSLMCSVGTTAAMRAGTQPIVQGVESFQVLYGVDGVTPHAAPTEAADGVPDRYLRADQMIVAGDEAATLTNWQRVRALRIGMVLRGPAGSLQDKNLPIVLYPLGAPMASAEDVGSIYNAPGDGRLRQTLSFTVHLRNMQQL
ncbi:MAG: PilW family protein [Pseudomonadota bacterium]